MLLIRVILKLHTEKIIPLHYSTKRDLEVTDIPIQNIFYSKVGFSSHIFWREENQRSWRKTLKAHERTNRQFYSHNIKSGGTRTQVTLMRSMLSHTLPCIPPVVGKSICNLSQNLTANPERLPSFQSSINLRVISLHSTP